MAESYNFTAASGGRLKKTEMTKDLSSGGSRTVTFDVAAALPQKYRNLTVDNMHCGFSACMTFSTVRANVNSVQYNSGTGIASVELSIASGHTFTGTLSLAIVYV